MTSAKSKQLIFSFILKYINKTSVALTSSTNDNDMKGNFYSAIEESKYDECYNIMRGLIPVKIAVMSLKEVIACGLPSAIADRIWNNKLLWLVCMHDDDIPKIHIADLRGKYSSHGLDIVEMRALWKVLRDKWPSGDARGEWLNTFKSKLEFLILKERQETLGPNESRHYVYSNNIVDENDLNEEDKSRFYPREIAYCDPDAPLIKRFGGDHTVVSSNHVYNSNDVIIKDIPVESDVLDEEFGFVVETELDDVVGSAIETVVNVDNETLPAPSPTWKEYYNSRKSKTIDEEDVEKEDTLPRQLSVDEDDTEIDNEIDNFVIPDELLRNCDSKTPEIVEVEENKSECDEVIATEITETVISEKVVRIRSNSDESIVASLSSSDDEKSVAPNEVVVSNEEETTTAEYQHLDDIVLTLDEMKEIFHKHETIEEFILLGDPRIAKELLIAGEIVLSDEDATALLIHCSELNEVIVAPLETLMFLIDNCKASVNATDFETGNTSLHYVFTNAVLGKFLVSRGADIMIKDNNGETPLSMCLEYGYTWIISSYKANFEQNPTLFGEEHASKILIYLLEQGYGQYVTDYVTSGIGKVSSDDALRIMELHQGNFDKLPQSVETYEILEQLILQEDE